MPNDKLRVAAMWVERGKACNSRLKLLNIKIDSLRSLVRVREQQLVEDQAVHSKYDEEILNLGGQIVNLESQRDSAINEAKYYKKEARKWKRRFVFGGITAVASWIVIAIL